MRQDSLNDGATLPEEFYRDDDVLKISRQLLGKVLCTFFDGVLTSGIIVETEAYRAPEDKASHAFGGRRTKRNAPMYMAGGVCYIYLCYGMHHLFNVVTGSVETPHAVLIRALEPLDGIEAMQRRRGLNALTKLCKGPAVLTQALGLTTALSGFALQRKPVWIEDRGIHVSDEEVVSTTRIGVDYAGEDALLPWRFYLRQCDHVSKKGIPIGYSSCAE